MSFIVFCSTRKGEYHVVRYCRFATWEDVPRKIADAYDAMRLDLALGKAYADAKDHARSSTRDLEAAVKLV
jgi:hypothetical protein